MFHVWVVFCLLAFFFLKLILCSSLPPFATRNSECGSCSNFEILNEIKTIFEFGKNFGDTIYVLFGHVCHEDIHTSNLLYSCSHSIQIFPLFIKNKFQYLRISNYTGELSLTTCICKHVFFTVLFLPERNVFKDNMTNILFLTM